MDISNRSPEMHPMNTRTALSESSRLRMWIGLAITLIGLLIFTVGAKPGWFGLGRSSGVGFVKISVFLLGLAIICLGGLLGVLTLWKGRERTLLAEIGMRLVGTGYVISVFSGISDLIGLGTEIPSGVPIFGPLQAAGVVIGQAVIAIGFLMMIPY
jgi:hypothetical protein